MSAGIDAFDLPLTRVVSGVDAIEHLGDELERLGVSRVVVVTGRSLSASWLLGRVTLPLGSRCVAVFRDARQHVPSVPVEQLARVLEVQRADCVVSFGGGSPVDTAKCAVHALWNAKPAKGSERPVALPHVAIPTTLSAGEFTAVAGITDEQTRVKRAISDQALVPRVVILDPRLTLETPSWLWHASGVRSVDHAVETLYSAHQHPVSTALASHGLARLVEHLPLSSSGDVDVQLAHRLACQTAAWMCVFGVMHAGLGLSHALGHQIGPRWDVAHGVTSCITLPHAMRLMARLAPARFETLAGSLGVAFDAARPVDSGLACADRVAAFVSALGLPTRLQDAGVPEADLDGLASVVHDIMSQAPAVAEPLTRDDVLSVLRAAY
jgi:alcohol dehydrogenase